MEKIRSFLIFCNINNIFNIMKHAITTILPIIKAKIDRKKELSILPKSKSSKTIKNIYFKINFFNVTISNTVSHKND